MNLNIGINQKVYQFLALLHYQISEASIKMHDFSTEWYSLSRELSIESLMKKLKLGSGRSISVKTEISNIISIFVIFGQSRFGSPKSFFSEENGFQ